MTGPIEQFRQSDELDLGLSIEVADLAETAITELRRLVRLLATDMPNDDLHIECHDEVWLVDKHGNHVQTLDSVLDDAANGYGHHLPESWEQATRHEVGDTLADFVVLEIVEVTSGYDDEVDARVEAARALNNAAEQLVDAAQAIRTPEPDFRFDPDVCPACGSPPDGYIYKVHALAVLVPDGDGYSYEGGSDVFWDAAERLPGPKGKYLLRCSQENVPAGEHCEASEWVAEEVAE